MPSNPFLFFFGFEISVTSLESTIILFQMDGPTFFLLASSLSLFLMSSQSFFPSLDLRACVPLYSVTGNTLTLRLPYCIYWWFGCLIHGKWSCYSPPHLCVWLEFWCMSTWVLMPMPVGKHVSNLSCFCSTISRLHHSHLVGTMWLWNHVTLEPKTPKTKFKTPPEPDTAQPGSLTPWGDSKVFLELFCHMAATLQIQIATDVPKITIIHHQICLPLQSYQCCHWILRL